MIGKIITAVAVACGIILLAMAVRANGGPEWIDQGRYTNPASGESCCGKYDCFQVNARWVKYDPGAGGFVVDWRGREQRVAEAETLRSKDEFYWLCQRSNGTIRCFFRPAMEG